MHPVKGGAGQRRRDLQTVVIGQQATWVTGCGGGSAWVCCSAKSRHGTRICLNALQIADRGGSKNNRDRHQGKHGYRGGGLTPMSGS